ncbi:hypothetical protein NOU10_06995 [Ligilactobacillus sp. MP3]|uniref:hypothetical protein n=1 Tax=Ligilactobacillus sp. MP3 TaxID=2965103 RepID=UPI00210EF040|nr:hypothetical protein [Ligilactobacillus sp. MP3]MCQ4117137.1 hypothetical protein [Ligilactobacillus sp. MP3]
MTQKRNLSTEKIIEAAKEIINKERAEKLSFSKVAGVLGGGTFSGDVSIFCR